MSVSHSVKPRENKEKIMTYSMNMFSWSTTNQ